MVDRPWGHFTEWDHGYTEQTKNKAQKISLMILYA